MSSILVAGDQISKSLMNHSPSKQLYSFPKADRFPKLKYPSSLCDSYNLPDVNSNRKTEFGRGNKSDFTNLSKGKCDKFYCIKSDFDSTILKSPRWSLGIGRENFKKVYYETEKTFDKDVPGPAKYDVIKSTGSESPKYSFRGKCEYKADKTIVPGPGEYAVKLQINSEGKFPLSGVRNIRKILFGVSKPDTKKSMDLPGPQSYNIPPLLNGNGRIFISKFKNSPSSTISKEQRVAKKLANFPGPGSYKIFSEFGNY